MTLDERLSKLDETRPYGENWRRPGIAAASESKNCKGSPLSCGQGWNACTNRAALVTGTRPPKGEA